jgi:hypothetical protein
VVSYALSKADKATVGTPKNLEECGAIACGSEVCRYEQEVAVKFTSLR